MSRSLLRPAMFAAESTFAQTLVHMQTTANHLIASHAFGHSSVAFTHAPVVLSLLCSVVAGERLSGS